MGRVNLMRSERVSAVLLVVAAGLGLALANSPWGAALLAVRDAHPDTGNPVLDLSPGHWVTDGLLAVFFLLAAIELRHELTHGELDSPRKALAPAVAAVGGVVVPALVFLLVVHDPELRNGWPIPTATDIAFALGVLALVGRGLPQPHPGLPARPRGDRRPDRDRPDRDSLHLRPRADPAAHRGPRRAALRVAELSDASQRLPAARRRARRARRCDLGARAALGDPPDDRGCRARARDGARTGRLAFSTAVEPWSNVVILPLFAFTASAVLLPGLSPSQLSPVFWGILLALPVGKLIGITGGALVARVLMPRAERSAGLRLGDIAVVAGLGGIGFTVSLLMNELAFRGQTDIAAQGTLGVLAGSLIAAVVGTAIAAGRAAVLRRRSRSSAR